MVENGISNHLKELRVDMGYELHLVTSRTGAHRSGVEEWLVSNGLRDYFDGLHFVGTYVDEKNGELAKKMKEMPGAGSGVVKGDEESRKMAEEVAMAFKKNIASKGKVGVSTTVITFHD